nr:hypothetical protein [Tanacetum cinerariifolium]
MDRIICDLNKTPDLFQEPPQNCSTCGNPVDGQYCQGCALLQKKFKEDLFTYCIENEIFQDFQDTSEPCNDNTNVVNALQEPFVVKQDPDENSSQSPPHINHHCCYGCGDSLEDIFFHQCTCEFCRKCAHYGYNCPPKYSVVHQPPREEISVEFLQEKRNQIDSVKTFLRKFNRISFYEMPKVLSLAWETILEIEHALEDKHCQSEDILALFRRLHNDVQNIHEELAVYINTLSWDRPTICYNDDDDEDYTIAVTPILSTEEPDNSLSMGDEHLDTILATESNELIKSSVENLVPIPKISSGSTTTRCDISLPDYEAFYDDHVTEISSGSTTTRCDISLPDYEAFYDDHVTEISSGSTTTHSNFSLYDLFIFDLSINPFPPADRSDFYHEEFADELAHIISPSEYDCFCFKNEPNSRDFTMDVVEDTFPTR